MSSQLELYSITSSLVVQFLREKNITRFLLKIELVTLPSIRNVTLNFPQRLLTS